VKIFEQPVMDEFIYEKYILTLKFDLVLTRLMWYF